MAVQIRALCLLLLGLYAAPSRGLHIKPPPPIAYVAYGGTVILECSATGTPTPSIKWQKESEWLTPENELILTNVTEEGEYTCHIEAGQLASSVTTKVEIRPLPRIPHSLEVSDVTSTTANVAWRYSYIPGTDDPTNYHLLLKPKADAGEPQDVNLDSAGTSYELTALTPGTEYQVQVVAEGTVGQGPASEPFYFTTKA